LHEFSKGDRAALDRLMPIVYSELHRIAHGKLRGERVGHTLNTTGLVHEAFLKLVNLRDVDWQDRTHFFAVAARLMRQILIDYARARNRDKRGGGKAELAVPAPFVFAGAGGDTLLALDEALEMLAWKQLGLHNKPIVILNIAGYWDPLLAMFARAVDENFIYERQRALYRAVPDVSGVLPAIAADL